MPPDTLAAMIFVAGRLLDEAYRKGQEERGRVSSDMDVGKECATEQAQRAKTGLADGRGAGAMAMQLGPPPPPGRRPPLLLRRRPGVPQLVRWTRI